MRPLAFALCCLLFCARGRADDASAFEERVERFTLDNGLRVVLAPDARHARVMMLVRYAVGGRDDPNGYRGLAHLTEHLTFREQDVMGELEKLGATGSNGMTTSDDTFYYAYLPARALEPALWLEASRMAFHLERVSEPELVRERAIVVAEWRQGRHNSVFGSVPQAMARELFPERHPYHQRGDEVDDVEAMSLRDVRWFAQQHYRPDRATLVVVGPFELEAVRDWVQRYFGAVRARGSAPVRNAQPAPAPLTRSCRLAVPEGVVDEVLFSTWLGPARNSDDEAVLNVIGHMLFGHPAAPLSKLARGVREIDDVVVGQERLELANVFSIVILARAPAKADELTPKLDAVLDALRRGDLNAELPSAVRRAREALRVAYDGVVQRAFALSDPNEPSLEVRLAQLARVTKEDVLRVARTWIDPRRRLLTMVTDGDPETSRRRVSCEDVP